MVIVSIIIVIVAGLILLSFIVDIKRNGKSKGDLHKVKCVLESPLCQFCTKLWKGARDKDREKANKDRLKLIISVAVFEIIILIVFSLLMYKLPEIKSIFGWLKTTATILIPAPVIYLIWTWRDLGKQREQTRQDRLAENAQRQVKQTQIQIEQSQRELKMREDQDKWKTFLEHLKTISNEDENEHIRAAAVYSLKEYFSPDEDPKYPQVAFNFLKNMVNTWVYRQYDKMMIEVSRKYPQFAGEKIFDVFDKCNLSIAKLLRIEAGIVRGRKSQPIHATHEIIVEMHKSKVVNMHKFEWSKILLDFIDLSRMNFERVNLACYSMNFSRINDINFKRAYLLGTHLNCAEILSSDFSWSLLQSAKFNGAIILGSDFNNSMLSYAEFKGASVLSSFFVNAKLLNAEFNRSNFTEVNFNKSNLSETNLQYAIFKRTNFKDTILICCDLSEIDLTENELSGALYSQSEVKSKPVLTNKKKSSISKLYKLFEENDYHTIFSSGFNPHEHEMINIWDLKEDKIYELLKPFLNK